MIFFDTSAWVEYFIGSSRGQKIREILEGDENIATPIIVLIELSCKAYKENTDFNAQLGFIRQNSAIINLDEDIVLDIGKIYAEMKKKNKKTSLAYAVIATISVSHGAVLITCDSDFKGLGNVQIIS